MLPHYSPVQGRRDLQRARRACIPGRIDLGLGRAAGTDPMTTHALQRDRSRALPDDFPQQLAELLAYFEGTIPVSSPLARLQKVLPGPPGDARAVAARLLAAERGLGGRAGPPVRVRGLHQPDGRGDRRALPARVRRRRAARRAAARRRRVGDRRRHRGGGRAAGRPQPDGVRDAAPRAPDRGPAAGRRASASSQSRGRRRCRPRRRAILGTPDAGARGDRGGRRASTARKR